MKKKVIAIAMLAVVALSSFAVLTGCGGGAPASDPQPSTIVSSQAINTKTIYTSNEFTTHEFNGYTFSIPDNWKKDEIDSSLYFYANPLSDSEFVMIASDNSMTSLSASDADLLYSALHDSFLSVEESKCVAPKSEVFNGITWYHMTIVGVLPDFSDTYIMEIYASILNNSLMTISFINDVNCSTDYSEALKTIVSSVSKNKETAASSEIIETTNTEPQTTSIPENKKETEKVTSSKPIESEVKTETVTTGERNALRSANSYLNYSAFSREGLIDQLEYEGYSTSEATYAVDHCGADWNEQALKSAKSYLNYSAFSHSGLIDQLEYEGFTSAQAKYGADHCNANWKEQAAKSAESYLKYSSFSRSDLIDQLEYEGFTYEQAVYGVEQNGY